MNTNRKEQFTDYVSNLINNIDLKCNITSRLEKCLPIVTEAEMLVAIYNCPKYYAFINEKDAALDLMKMLNDKVIQDNEIVNRIEKFIKDKESNEYVAESDYFHVLWLAIDDALKSLDNYKYTRKELL